MYVPIHLDVRDMNIAVIGGGEIAWRKCQFFIVNKIPVTVVAKTFISDFKEPSSEKITLIEAAYKVDDIKDSHLVIAATNDAVLNDEIGAYCKAEGKLVNVASSALASNFIMPGIVQRSDLLLSVSTSGKNPSLAKSIKQELQEQYGPEYEKIVQESIRVKGK